ncbi:MAG: CDP-glucose 4,6-dehydratase [bacterium]
MAVGRGTLESLVVDPAFWAGKRVFLTGHTGFKGGWLAHWLKSMGAVITGYALEAPTNPALFSVATIDEGLTHIIADLRDGDTLNKAVAEAQPEIVFHLAAQPLVRRSYEAPEETFAVNVMGTLNLFEAVRAVGGVKALVNVTSDKCYENREWIWAYREDEPLGGFDPYSASKTCAEILTASYRRAFFEGLVPIATARAGNVIGGGDWGTDRLVPDIMRGFTAKQPVCIRNPEAIRPWQHVLDALSGYLGLAQHLAGPDGERFAQAWNFGPDRNSELSVAEIVRELALLWGEGARYEMASRKNGPHEATFLKLDSTKARLQLGWIPRWGLDDALHATVEWYRAHADQSADLTSLMDVQIARHQKGGSDAGVKKPRH